ncbi:MAG TPA: hypothetical protein VGI67_05045 [Thermoleophilaceae bacterium]
MTYSAEHAGQFHTDPLEEAMRVIAAGEERGVKLRATGGVGIALISPSALRPPLQRRYQDIDFVVSSKQTNEVEHLFHELGYEPDEEFNVLHGQHRLFFLDSVHQRQADVFLDRVEMCHVMDLRERLTIGDRSLTPADLLLSKLQVVETNEKDYKDAIAVLADHEVTADDSGININRINDLCASDWGWWRTVTMVAERTDKIARELSQGLDGRALAHVPDRIRHLLAEIDRADKSRRWKMRARIGDRVPWHDTPEDIDHD